MNNKIKFLVLGFAFLSLFNCKKINSPNNENEIDLEVQNFVSVLEKNIDNKWPHLDIDSTWSLNHLALIPQNSWNWPGDEVYLASLLESYIYFYDYKNSKSYTFFITEKNLVLVPDDYKKNTKLYTLAEQEDIAFLRNAEEPLIYFGKSNEFFIPYKNYNGYYEIASKIQNQSKIRIVIGDKMLETIIKPSWSKPTDSYFFLRFHYIRRNYFTNPNFMPSFVNISSVTLMYDLKTKLN